ncbi:glycosyltransferase family 39 protein [uncultured Schumannella sp.]|uniref:glycosyltransferase family 39 protein n=1 Tax=uncultured Schumannella sp. TaxID=1195956 RepID=UPI0025D5CD11|nr:glycosyltransferase family 39 protein [uncultured Schumannella sp.]
MVWPIFVPLAIVLSALVVAFNRLAVPTQPWSALGALAAFVFAGVWFALNLPMASEYIVAIRDPGIYMVTGANIAVTGGSPIDVRQASQLAELSPTITEKLGVFATSSDGITRLQGSNGYPAMVAIGFWVAGVEGGTSTNLVIGAVALIALYGLARRVVGPVWALVPSVLMGASMPFTYLSRTSYTEILATLVVLAGSTVLLSALRSQRTTQFVLAGALIASAALTRIDGALAFTGASFGLVLIALGAGRAVSVSRPLTNIVAFSAAGWLIIGLGALDLVLNTPRYLSDLGSMPQLLWLGTAIVSVVLIAVSALPLARRGPWAPRTTKRVAIGGAVIVAGLFIYWVSRPLWMTNHFISHPSYQRAVEALQAQDGLPLDGSQSYDEYTLWWFAWYFGWPLLLGAIVGITLWLYRAVSDHKPEWIVLIAVAAASAMLYFNVVSVTPDQIWAFRRVLPVITPTLLIAFAFALAVWWRRGRVSRWLALGTLAVSGALTLSPWGQIFFETEAGSQASEISAICDAVEEIQVDVVAIASANLPANYAPTVRTMCDVQVVTVSGGSRDDLRLLADATDGKLAALTFGADALDWTATPSEATATTTVKYWNRHLLMTPRTTNLTVREAFVGSVNSDGSVTPAN